MKWQKSHGTVVRYVHRSEIRKPFERNNTMVDEPLSSDDDEMFLVWHVTARKESLEKKEKRLQTGQTTPITSTKLLDFVQSTSKE